MELERLPPRIARHIVIDDDGCWIWSAALDLAGYGQVNLERKRYRAHRLIYTLLVGPIPTGFQLDHLCRVRRCVNPAHLEAVTPGENTRRGMTGTTASTVVTLPGPPSQTDLAFLAGLLDNRGGFVSSRMNVLGLKVSHHDDRLVDWLVIRFAGRSRGNTWQLTRQADLRYVLARVRPFLVVRHGECEAMLTLLEHLPRRREYGSNLDWRAERDRLLRAVRDARGAGA